MREGGLRIRQLRGRVRVAVEGEDTARLERSRCQRVVEVLSCGIAIDLDRDTALGRQCKHLVPIGDDPGPRSAHSAARVGEDPHRRMRDRRQHTTGLVVSLAQPRMRRGQHHVEAVRFFVGEIQLTGNIDVGFDSLQQPKLVAELAINVVDGVSLLSGFGH